MGDNILGPDPEELFLLAAELGLDPFYLRKSHSEELELQKTENSFKESS